MRNGGIVYRDDEALRNLLDLYRGRFPELLADAAAEIFQ